MDRLRDVPDRPSSTAQLSTTVDRAGALLRLLAQHPQGLGITRLTKELGTQRAPLYRILQALIEHGLVRRDARKQYLLGVGTLELARAYAAQFPSGIEAMLAALADETGMTATLVSVSGEELTTAFAKVPSTSEAHVYTPPGFRHPSGRLSMRIALEALAPPSDDDPEDVRDTRRLGYAVGHGEVVPSRYGAAAVVPGSGESGAILIVALVTLRDFEHTAIGEPLLRTARAIGHTFGTP